MRTVAAMLLMALLASCSDDPDLVPAADRSIAGDSSEEEEAARMSCMLTLPDAETYPSPDAYERSLSRCVEDELQDET